MLDTPSPLWQRCSLPLRAMYVAPFLGTQLVYVAIKQAIAVCSQNPFKCSVSERVRAHAGSMAQEAAVSKCCAFFSATAESGKPLLKEMWHAAHKQQEVMLNFVLIVCMCLEFLFKLSQVLHGCSQPTLACQFVVGVPK